MGVGKTWFTALLIAVHNAFHLLLQILLLWMRRDKPPENKMLDNFLFWGSILILQSQQKPVIMPVFQRNIASLFL